MNILTLITDITLIFACLYLIISIRENNKR